MQAEYPLRRGGNKIHRLEAHGSPERLTHALAIDNKDRNFTVKVFHLSCISSPAPNLTSIGRPALSSNLPASPRQAIVVSPTPTSYESVRNLSSHLCRIDWYQKKSTGRTSRFGHANVVGFKSPLITPSAYYRMHRARDGRDLPRKKFRS